jgi:Tol biopolymer transport system component
VTASRGRNGPAEISPDGTRIVFVSDRSGSDEIYVCNADGSNLLQLTRLGSTRTPGLPRWSPDGRKIIFNSVLRGQTSIFVIPSDGGTPRPLTDQTSENLNPSWSHDGNWIYFTSNRSGDWQIWKMTNQGEQAFQLTRQGGFEAFESVDGKFIYYANTASEPDIWKMRLQDGQETALSPPVHLQQYPGWALTSKGILFVHEGPTMHPVLRFIDFANAQVKDVAPLSKQPWPLWISASGDGRVVMHQQVDMAVSNIMSLENFH